MQNNERPVPFEYVQELFCFFQTRTESNFHLEFSKLSIIPQPDSFVDLFMAAWRLDVGGGLMAHDGARNHDRLAAQHSCQSAPQCPLALINCFSSYQRTRSILPHCGGVVEQTNMICHHLFAWLYWWQCTSGFAVKWFSGCEWWRGSRCC